MSFPAILGWDVSGTVEKVGPDVVAEAVRSGKLSIPLGQRFALKDANKAHAAAEKGAAGKILLVA